MATKTPQISDIRRIKEVIRLLNLALESCHKLLSEAERAVHEGGQDNDPPRLSD